MRITSLVVILTQHFVVNGACAIKRHGRLVLLKGVTEIVEIPNRGHALVIDSGWRKVADTALAFVRRFV